MWKKRMKKKKKEKEKRTENGEGDTRNTPPSPDTFPSTKLGNNMTPIKGRLGKNTTPTSKSPTELNQNLQVDPQRRRPDFNASSRTDFSYAPEEAEYSKYKLHSNEAAIYKKAKALKKLQKRFKISIKDARTFPRKSEVE